MEQLTETGRDLRNQRAEMDNPQLWADFSHDHLHRRPVVGLYSSRAQLL
jgi:hypothetical protein